MVKNTNKKQTVREKLWTTLSRGIRTILVPYADNIVRQIRLAVFYTLCGVIIIGWGIHFFFGWMGSEQPQLLTLSLTEWSICILLFILFLAKKISLETAFLLLAILMETLEGMGMITIANLALTGPQEQCRNYLIVNEITTFGIFIFCCMGLMRKTTTCALAIYLVLLCIAYKTNPPLVQSQFLLLFIYIMMTLWAYTLIVRLWFDSSSREIKNYRQWQESILDVLHIKKVELLALIQICRHSVQNSSIDSEAMGHLSKSTRDGLIELGQYLSRQQQGHIEYLKTLFPQLTPTELEICHLVVKGLTIKEIATTTNRSMSNIGTVRGNIRRKLNIPTDTDLRQYLQHQLRHS